MTGKKKKENDIRLKKKKPKTQIVRELKLWNVFLVAALTHKDLHQWCTTKNKTIKKKQKQTNHP